jgi:hypothetical protein
MSASETSVLEENVAGVCERCDRETRRIVKLTRPDNSVEHVCWSCLYRQEKRINLKETWKRQRRG